MKKKKKSLLSVFFIIFMIVFMLAFCVWYNLTADIYKYDTFKEELILEMNEDPVKFNEDINEVFKGELVVNSVDDLTDEVIDSIYNESIKYRYIFIISTSLPIAIFGSLLIFTPVFFVTSSRKKYDRYRLSIDKFKKNTGYYRDLLKDYNPLELSYNNNYNLDNNSLAAMILYLENRGVLKLVDGKYITSSDDFDSLSPSDKKFVNYISVKNDGNIEVSHQNITSLTDRSCKEKKLLMMDTIPKKRFIVDIIFSIICYFGIRYLWNNINTIFDMLPPIENGFIVISVFCLTIGLGLLFLFYPFVTIIKYYILYYTIKSKKSKKTDLGNDINYKLDGLKNFIRGFSNLDKKSKEEVVLWDDYLIYSVLFGDNKKVCNEILEKVKYVF